MKRLSKFLIFILVFSVLLENMVYASDNAMCFAIDEPTYYGFSFTIIIQDVDIDLIVPSNCLESWNTNIIGNFIYSHSYETELLGFGLNKLLYLQRSGLDNLYICDNGLYFCLNFKKDLDIGDGLFIDRTLYVSPIFIILCAVIVCLIIIIKKRIKSNESRDSLNEKIE